MRKSFESEKGAISLIALVTVLFIMSFLMSTFIVLSNRAQISAETTAEIARKYNNIGDANSIYNTYLPDEDIIPIYTVDHLRQIGSGNQIEIDGKYYTYSEDGYYILKNDLDLGGYDYTNDTWINANQWSPLPLTFTGYLDGLGHTIKGLYINEPSSNYQGLFGELNGTVKNINIEDSYVIGNGYVGAIAGLNNGTIINCKNTGNISGNTNVTGGFFTEVGQNGIIDVWSENNVLDRNCEFVSGNKIAVVPKGFKVSVDVFEQSIDDGMVIKDSDGNEFVWIPVPEINDMVMCKTHGASVTLNSTTLECPTCLGNTVLVGKLYSTDKGQYYNGSLTNQTYSISLKEPYNLTSASYKDDTSRMPYWTSTLYQERFRSMAESVRDNKGFYIGRYEMSLADDTEQTPQSMYGKTPYTTTVWWNYYMKAEEYNVNGIVSEMVWGAQWDQMMKWMENNGINVTIANPIDPIIGTTVKNTSRITGDQPKDRINNLFDLLGNNLEYSQTAYQNDSRSCRGGSYKSNQSFSPSYYGYGYSTSSYEHVATRMTFYISPTSL